MSEVLGRAGMWAHEIRVEHTDLEDAFLHLTAGDDSAAGASANEHEEPDAAPRR